MRTQCVHYTYYANGNDRLKTETSDVNPAVTYTYDNNGSMTSKAVAGATTVNYAYNVAQRLVELSYGVIQHQYTYNDQGVRTSYTMIDDSDVKVITNYLIDPANPTGYAQVFEELDAGYTPTMTYTIGDDVLTQANDDDTEIRHLMYDGHGSTRLLTDDNGDIKATYAYDAYGNAEGFTASSAATKYLYAGEQYDANLGMTYLRGRYYLPTLGIFNRMDPFQGDPFAPQSLHKYAYCYNNPVNAIDPSGMLGIIGLTGSIALISLLSGVIAGAINKFVFGGSFSRTFVQVTAGSFLAMGMIAIYPPIAPWAWTIATFVVQTLWEWIVNGFDKPGESITRILFMTILTGFLGLGAKMFNVSQFTAFNADRLIHALGIRDVVGRIAIEVGKSTLKGLTVFAAIERIASALLDLWFELIGMPRRDLEREYRKAMG